MIWRIPGISLNLHYPKEDDGELYTACPIIKGSRGIEPLNPLPQRRIRHTLPAYLCLKTALRRSEIREYYKVIKNMLDPKERFRKYSLRSVFDGILYIVKTGVQWRMLPSDFAPWQTVYYYFSKWKNEGLLEEIFDTLRGIVRRLSGRAESPSLGIIDSRSVRTSHHIDGQRGIDGNKKIKGRKEHIVVDTLGLPMSVRVHPANVHDSVGAEEVFESMRYKFTGLKRILADGGYRGETVRNTVKRLLHCDLDVVLRSDKRTDRFVPMPKRWIVERTFSWLENFRRLTIDYEYRADTHEAMLHIAAIKLFLNKI